MSPLPPTLAAGALLSLLAVPAAAQQGGIEAVGAPHPIGAAAVRGAPIAGARPLPMSLPPAAASAARALPRRWLVGAAAGARSTALAHRFGARRVLPRTGIFVLSRGRANAFAATLRRQGLLVYAEPDRRVKLRSFPTDLLTGGQW